MSKKNKEVKPLHTWQRVLLIILIIILILVSITAGIITYFVASKLRAN